jgi:hypothetical protein
LGGVADPVSWLQIEHGWQVCAAGGEAVGSVAEVTGDKQEDIFDGLAVQFGHSGPVRYVPGESVGAIYPGEVRLTITSAAADQLEPFEKPPPELVIMPEKAPLLARAKGWLSRK